MTATATACGSSGSGGENTSAGENGKGGGPGVAAAKSSLAKYTEASPLKPAGKPFDASKARGKLVEVVTQQASNPAIATVAAAIKDGLTHEGVRINDCDAKGASVKISSCIRRGLSQKADAVVVTGGDPTAYSSGLRAATAAGVPVFSALDVPLPSAVKSSGVDPSGLDSKLKGLAGNAAPPDAISGTLAADFVTADSNGSGQVLFISSPGIVGGAYLKKAFLHELKKVCSDCSVTVKAVTILNWPSDITPLVSAQLAKNPELDYVVPVFDPMATYTNPAISQAGKRGQVKVVSANGSLQQMQEMARGNSIIVCDVGQNLTELGFISADQVLRELAGAPAVKDSAPQVRVWTERNIGSIKVTADAFKTGQWYTGSPDALRNTYYELWSGKN